MYQLEWTRLFPADGPIAVSAVVCVVGNHRLCRSLNPCRIIYLIEESGGEYLIEESGGEIELYGFAFGALPGHSEEGEERFLVEWNRADDSVWYELLAFAPRTTF